MFKYSYLERKFHCSQWGKKHRMFTKWHNNNDVGLSIWRSMIVRDYGIGDSQEWARKLGNAIAISLKQSIHAQQAKLHNQTSGLLRTFKRKFQIEKTVVFMEKMLTKAIPSQLVTKKFHAVETLDKTAMYPTSEHTRKEAGSNLKSCWLFLRVSRLVSIKNCSQGQASTTFYLKV